MSRAVFYGSSFTNCGFEKVNLRGSDFDTCQFKMTKFSESNLGEIIVENVKMKFGECKEWLEIKDFSDVDNYSSRSDNGNLYFYIYSQLTINYYTLISLK